MRARFLIAVGLVVASTFAARPAGAQVGGQMNASPNPFEYEDDYVSVWFVASWDTSVFCGVDGGCQDVWCDADYVDVNINDGEFTYVDCPGPGCYGPSPGDGWFSIGFDDYGPPYAMQDAWYFGEANVHWSNGSFSYGTSGGDVVQARAAYNWQCGQGDVGRAKLIQQYVDRSITAPSCSQIRTSLNSSYSYVGWSDFANGPNDNDLYSPYGIAVVSELMASDVDLLFDYYVNYSSPGTPVVTSGYRTPNRNPGVSTSLHLYGRATDANVPGWFDSSHHGDINDPSSQSPTVAYAIWDDLAQHALSNGADNVESWSTMYQQGGNSNSALNHVHASYGYTQ